MASRTEARLVTECRRGDPAAWEELLERYGRLIWAVATRLGARHDEAEEVFQRTWVAVVEGLDGLRKPGRLASWIAGTARNHTFRLFAEQARRRRDQGQGTDSGADHEPTAPVDLEAGLIQVEESLALHQALGRLDPRCRELLELLFLEDPPLEYAEVAARTGMAIGSIGPTRGRCLGKLERFFGEVYQKGDGMDS